MKQKSFLFAIVIITGIVALFSLLNRKDNQKSEVININSVDSTEFLELSKAEGAFLLDVHIPEQMHLPGTDGFIPYNEIEKNLDKLPSDKNAPLLVYCRSGSMSKEASYELQKLGYTNVYDLEGGIEGLSEDLGVTLSPMSQDLGVVVYGDVAVTDFTITNFTAKEINITEISTSCGCTKAEIDNKVLAPYESATVNVTFDPAVHKDDTDLGELTRTIYIKTDNPKFRQISSTITANVVRKDGD